ncbi:MAG: glycosyltransferase family 4 protein [Candidatus Omnitrophota bacterium]
MRIILLTNHLNAGGITTYVLFLAKGLKERGHQVKVVSRGGERLKDLERWGIEHIFLNLFTKSEVSLKIYQAKRKLCSILKKEDVDLLHPQTRITRIIAEYIQNKLNIPFVTTAHGFYKKRLSHKIFPCWGKKVIAISNAVKEDLIRKFNLPDNRIKVIYNGVSIEKFKMQNAKSKMETDKGEIIGIVSRLSEIKGHPYLLRAMKEILKNFPQAQLFIVGEGKMKNYLLKLVRKLRIEKNVFFISSVLDTSSLFSNLDVFVLPSLEEGLGMAILEAMAWGVPVVATDVGGIPEIIQDGKNGLLVSPQDYKSLSRAICRVLESPDLKNKFIINGRRTVEEKFSLEKMLGETERLYYEILNEEKTYCQC